MSERERPSEEHQPSNEHVLRVPVFDLYNEVLISRDFNIPQLFVHRAKLGDRGQHLAPIEYRATSIGFGIKKNEKLPVEVLPALEPLGYIGSLESNPTGFAVVTSKKVDLRNFAAGFRGYDLEDIYEKSTEELREPGSTVIDRTDAYFLVTAFHRFRQLQRFTDLQK